MKSQITFETLEWITFVDRNSRTNDKHINIEFSSITRLNPVL